MSDPVLFTKAKFKVDMAKVTVRYQRCSDKMWQWRDWGLIADTSISEGWSV